MKSNLSHDKYLFIIIVAAIIFFIGYAHKRSFRLQNYKKMIIWPNYSWTFFISLFLLRTFLRFRCFYFTETSAPWHRNFYALKNSLHSTPTPYNALRINRINGCRLVKLPIPCLHRCILLVISSWKVPGVECRLFFSSVEIVLKKSERTTKKSTCGNLNRHTSTCSTHTLKWLLLHAPFT